MKRTKTINNKEYVELIKQLRVERKRLGLLQIEVANLLKMKQSEISKIETCERRLDILEFKELLIIYGLTNNDNLNVIVSEFLWDIQTPNIINCRG